ncbi:mucin-2-like [Silurus meridionalis]|uniref:mucin-2-like n=1 Tax=Silurus meridionalis TaxID=175797 RepID=UPI001EEC9650|nr:mucin-2-like [Silurus meridionalis]
MTTPKATSSMPTEVVTTRVKAEDPWTKQAIEIIERRTRSTAPSTPHNTPTHKPTSLTTGNSEESTTIPTHKPETKSTVTSTDSSPSPTSITAGIGNPDSCCTKVTTTKVKVEQIVSYLHQDDILCPIKAVRFKLLNGREICSDPNDSWTKNAIKKINAGKTTPTPKTPSTYGRKNTLSTSSPEISRGSTATMTTPKATSSMRPETSTESTSTTTTPKATSSKGPWTTTKMMTTTATNPPTTDSKTTHTTTLPTTRVTTTTPSTAWKKTTHTTHTSSTRIPFGKDNKPREWTTTTTTTTTSSTQITTTEMTTMTDKTPMPTSVTRQNGLTRTSRTSPRITTSKPTPYTSPTASTKRLHGKIWTLMTTMQTATERKPVTTKPMTMKTSTKPMTAILQRPTKITIRCQTSMLKSTGNKLPWTVRRLIKKKRKGLRRAQMNIKCL